MSASRFTRFSLFRRAIVWCGSLAASVALLYVSILPGTVEAAAPAVAACTVTSSADALAPPIGSLRAMLANLSCDSIDFAPGVSHIVLAGELRPSRSVSIIGPGAHLLTLDGNNKTYRVFTSWVPGSVGTVVEISGLTITGGRTSLGGGILNLEGTLTLRDVIVAGNRGTSAAGGIRNSNGGTLHLIDVLVAENTTPGTSGGVESHTGALTTMKNVTIRNNTAGSWGGGFYSSEPSVIENSTFSDNSAQQYGGVFMAGNSALRMVNSTIANNTATNIIGGLGLAGNGPHHIVNSTVANNAATNGGGGGIRTLSLNGVASLKNVIVSGNSPENCAGNLLTTVGVNISDDASCGGFMPVGAMLLGALADNGGPTWTMALLDGSPAIDVAVDCTDFDSNPVLLDQRGVGRPVGAVCDAGAYETTAVAAEDTEAPVFGELPHLAFPATFPSGAIVSYGVAVVDNEDPAPSVVCEPPSNTTFAIGVTTVVCTATDAAGNSASSTFTVTVTNSAPTLVVPANQTVEATNATGATVTFAATGSDVEDGAIAAVCAPQSGRVFPLGISSVTCVVTDTAGSTASGSFNVTVVPPVLDVLSISMETRRWISPAPTSGLEAASIYHARPLGVAGYAPGPVGLTLFQNVNNAIVFGGVNNSIASHYRVVIDVPIEGPLDVRIGTDMGRGGALLLDGDVLDFRTNDMYVGHTNWTDPSQFLAGSVTVSAGTHVIEVYGFENCCDGPGRAEFSYLGSPYVPFQAPANDVPAVALSGPSPVSYGSTQTYTFAVTDDGASFSVVQASCGIRGDLAGPVTLVPGGGSFDCAFHSPGVSQVTVQVDDDRGARSGVAGIAVSVVNTRPTIEASPDQTVEATSAAGAVVTFTVTAHDEEDGPIAAVCAPASGTTFPLGTRTVRCTATDSAGARTADVFTVTVVDTTAPTVVYSGNAGTYQVSETINITCAATDAVGVATTTCANISGPATSFLVGANTVTSTATDAAGNTTTASVTFTVVVTSTGLQDLITQIAGASAPQLVSAVQNITTAPNANARAGRVISFRNQVNAQLKSGKITAEQAALLSTLVGSMN